MHDFSKSVPFDPGFSGLSFSFMENIVLANQEYSRLKANHQKKFWLVKGEPVIINFIKKSTAFYLGCMLWGGFIHSRFKDAPKEISGNDAPELSEKERQEFDCAVEAKAILEYIKSFNKDIKYFLKRPVKIPPIIVEVLENYIEFAKINDNFFDVKNTRDIKLPTLVSHFGRLSDVQLDGLCEKIYAAIESGEIDLLFEIDFKGDL